MKTSKSGPWIGGAAFAAVVILLASWFLVISPVMEKTSDTKEQTKAAELQNDILRSAISTLQADAANLPKYQADLAALRTKIPTVIDSAGFRAEVDRLAKAHSVTITMFNEIAPSSVLVAAPATTAPTTAASPTDTATAAATDDGTSGSAADPSAETTTAAPSVGAPLLDGFAYVQLTIGVLGTYDNTAGFLHDLQYGTPRSFLVSALTSTQQKKQDASGGRPATALGDVEITITGELFVLKDAFTPVEPTAPSTTAPVLPTPTAPRNPFFPVGPADN